MKTKYKNLLQLFTVFLLMLASTSLKAQSNKAGLNGHIITSDGKPAALVTVSLPQFNITTHTNEGGGYVFHNLTPGSYTVKVSFVGLSTQDKQVYLVAGTLSTVDFTLSETLAKLDEVVVFARKTQHLRRVSAGKSDLSMFDMPQSMGVVNNQVIRDQQINRLGDAIKNVSGVSLTQTRGGVGETFTARGYSISIGGGAGSIFKDGVLVNTAGFPEASTLESVEVLKGSSALLYGNVSGGLIINMVTKKPKFETGGEVSMRYGSYNLYKPAFDVYGPISNNLAFRVVGVYENAGSYRNQVKTERTDINPSFLYNLGKKTTLLLSTEYLKSNLTPDWGVGSLNNGQAIPTMVPRSQFINTTWAYSKMDQYTGSLTLNHQFNDDWHLSVITSAQGTRIDSYGSGLPNNTAANGDWNRGLARANTKEDDYTGQANLNGKFKTGPLNHQLLIGTDVAKVLTYNNAYAIAGLNTINGVANVYDVINIIDLNKYTQRTDVPAATLITTTKAPVYRFGSYAQDLISLTDKFKILAGVRWSWQQTLQTGIDSVQKQRTGLGAAATKYDRAFSPKASLIYQPDKTSSIYVSYSNNFMVNTGTDVFTRQALAPSLVDQYEAGVKNEFFDGKVSANLSIYRIINNNLAVVAPFLADGTTTNTNTTVKQFSGQTTSDGIELDVNANLSQNFYFIVGGAYNNARYTKTSGLSRSNIEGEQLVINPKFTANGSVFYTFCGPALKGFKIGASTFYTGKRLAGYNNTVGQIQNYSRLLSVGSYATVDITAGYTYKKLSLLAGLTNITNTMNYLIHDNYSVTPIPPRQLLTTLAYKF